MAIRPRVWLAVALLLAAVRAADAHHSIAGMYDGNRRVSVEGDVVQFDFINPHALVTLEVLGAEGEPEQWRLEMTTAARCRRSG